MAPKENSTMRRCLFWWVLEDWIWDDKQPAGRKMNLAPRQIGTCSTGG